METQNKKNMIEIEKQHQRNMIEMEKLHQRNMIDMRTKFKLLNDRIERLENIIYNKQK